MTSDSVARVERALDAGATGLPNLLTHFVGRARGGKPVPAGLPSTAEGRVASILLTRCLLASRVPSSDVDRVVSASDASAAELETAFARGINRRGALEPWAVLLDRVAVYREGAGMRPVHYVHHSRLKSYRKACEVIDGPGWGGLVIPIRLTSRAGSYSDWMHEREWRWCAPSEPKTAAFSIRKAIKAVIVGERGWEPTWTRSAPALSGLLLPEDAEYVIERWFWDPDLRQLVRDGTLTVPGLPAPAPAKASEGNTEDAGSADAATSGLVQLSSTGVAGLKGVSGAEQPTEVRVSPEQILIPGGEAASPWVWELNCPSCGGGDIDRSANGDYVEVDEQAVTIHPDEDKYGSPIGTRGGWVTVDLMCTACGHHFALVIANHKGAERIGIVSR